MIVEKAYTPIDGVCMETRGKMSCVGAVLKIEIEGHNLITEIRLCRLHASRLKNELEKALSFRN